MYILSASLLSSQAMVCITAGACMAIGLRYAGTSNQQAHTLLVSHDDIIDDHMMIM